MHLEAAYSFLFVSGRSEFLGMYHHILHHTFERILVVK